jgi:hypothetical protein
MLNDLRFRLRVLLRREAMETELDEEHFDHARRAMKVDPRIALRCE